MVETYTEPLGNSVQDKENTRRESLDQKKKGTKKIYNVLVHLITIQIKNTENNQLQVREIQNIIIKV